MKIELLDLRPITRDVDKVLTILSLSNDPYSDFDGAWIKAGECFRLDRTTSKWPSYEISAKLKDGATDGEHDSAYAFSIPLVGLEYQGTHWHTVQFRAMIDPSLNADCGRAFNVPEQGFDPFKNPKYVCTNCEEQHIFTDYLPEHNVELYQKLKGKWINIVLTRPYDKE